MSRTLSTPDSDLWTRIYFKRRSIHIIIISIAVQKWYYPYPCLPWWLQWIPQRTTPLPPNLRGSLSKDKKVASIFEPAADLDVFRNTDQARFEWVNSSEIQPGMTTCGFLKSPWGWPVGSIPDFMNLEIASISPLLKFVSIILWSHYWYLENDLFILYLHIQNTTQTYVSGLLKNSQHLGVTL